MRCGVFKRAGFVALVLVWLVGCGGDNGGSQTGDTTGGGDVAAADGTAGDSGGETRLPPEPEKECETDAECFGEGQVCDCTGSCVAGGFAQCESDKNCGGGNFCDPCTGTCFAKGELCDPCRSEHMCNPISGECVPTGNQCDVDGSHCLDFVTGGSYCGRACLSNAGCPAGYTCEDLSGFGLEYSQCIPNGATCNQLGECQEDMDCEFKFICNQENICVKGCEEDAECPSGTVCSGFRCSQACDPVNNPCPEGQECVQGRCMIPGGCIDAYDCPQPETFCNPQTNMCEPGCLEDIDCKSGAKECVNGKCEFKPCTANYWCSFGLVCDLEAGECVEPPEPFCEPGCEEDAECGPEPSKCLELQDEDGNSKGKFCFPKCYDDPNNRCPQGYQCTELVDQDGNSAGEVCARTCYEEPVGFY